MTLRILGILAAFVILGAMVLHSQGYIFTPQAEVYYTFIGGTPLQAGQCSSAFISVDNASWVPVATPLQDPGPGFYWRARGVFSYPPQVVVELCAAQAGTPQLSYYRVLTFRPY